MLSKRNNHSNTFNKQIMKTQNTIFLASLSKADVDNLTKEVKETIATGIAPVNQKAVFSAADYWNLQRIRKNRTGRRYLVA